MTKKLFILCAIVVGPLPFMGCGESDAAKEHADEVLSTETENWKAGSQEAEEVANTLDSTSDESESGETNPVDPWGSNEDPDSGFEICRSVTDSLEQVATRIMILLDRSESMNEDNKWELALSAIDSMVSEFDKRIAFGLDVFSASTEGDRSFRRDSAMCNVGDNAVLDVALDNGSEILSALNRLRPGQATPLLLAIMNYGDPDYSVRFMDSKGSSYLVIISDGMDTCGNTGEFDRSGGASTEQLSDAVAQLKRESEIKTVVIGFGEGVDPAQLNAIAQSGGTPFTQYFNAADGDELTEALDSIAEAVVVSCRFEVGQIDESELNLDLVNIFIDDKAIPRDIDCSKNTGWTWTDADRTTIELCKAACDEIKANEADDFRLEIACSADDVMII